MSPDDDPRPVPEPDEVSQFYWDAARDGRLDLQRCDACARLQFPPDIVCVHCQSLELTPATVSGRGAVYAYAVVDRAFHEGFVDALPYVIGLVELDEQPGLRLLTNLVGAAPESWQVGMPVEVSFEPRRDAVLPQFRRAQSPPAGAAT